jgi:serine/threonine protein kinase
MNAVTRSTWERLSPLLDEFLDLPESGRAGRMAELRAEDPKLADALAGMLQHLPEIEREGFMERPIVPPAPGLEGQVIGPYTLAREIGHGGMGTVWQARRTDGRYEGDVAFKFLRTGLFGHGDAARFEREGSILARLSHPHIARLLDAGVTHDGQQPYLVLEYIDGEPIDKYCERLALPPSARLKLFLDVLSAVAHAHNRLILHRDLKPSNILVTASGDVKLLDFGIAKLLDDSSGAGTAPGDVTALAGNAFTPEYAAPEQLQGGDVTTATDVYALGVLMYVLLGGDHPTNSPTGAPLDRMRAVIDMEPKRLSNSVLKRGGPTARYSVESKKLSRELRGDVDTIVGKALKKKPAERYANAVELSDDVRRYLAHEPIAARPDARLYRTGKFLRRHWVGVTAAGVAAMALGVGGGVALWQAHEAQAQRVQAEGLIEYMLGDLRKKLQPVGRLDILDGVGEKALAYYRAQDLTKLDPDSLGRRARTLHLIGDLAERRGKLDEAQQDFQEAASTTAALLERYPGDGQRVFDQSQSEYYLGYIQLRRGHLHDSEIAFRRYSTLADRMTKLNPKNKDWGMEKIYAAQNIAIVLLYLGDTSNALTMSNDVLIAKEVNAGQSSATDLSIVNTLGWKSQAQRGLGQYDESIASEERKIEIAESLSDSKTNHQAKYWIANGNANLARNFNDLGQPEKAIKLARTALAEQSYLVNSDPSNLDWVSEMALMQLQLASLLERKGATSEARLILSEVHPSLVKLMAAEVPKPGWRISLQGESLLLKLRLTASPSELSEVKIAMTTYLSDVQKFEQSGRELNSLERLTSGGVGIRLGALLAASGHEMEAKAVWQTAVDRLRPAAEHANPEHMTRLAEALFYLGATQEARTWADRVRGTQFRQPEFSDLQKMVELIPGQEDPPHQQKE